MISVDKSGYSHSLQLSLQDGNYCYLKEGFEFGIHLVSTVSRIYLSRHINASFNSTALYLKFSSSFLHCC